MKKVILITLALAPALVFAQGSPSLTNLSTLLTAIGSLVATALPIVVGLALLVFFWGLVKFIFSQGNEEGKADAKRIMLWGIIALFVMISVWGLVKFMQSAFGINATDTIETPKVPGI